MTHVTCRLTAKNRDQLWNPALGNRVWATFTFFYFFPNQKCVAKPSVNPSDLVAQTIAVNSEGGGRVVDQSLPLRCDPLICCRMPVQRLEVGYANYFRFAPKICYHSNILRANYTFCSHTRNFTRRDNLASILTLAPEFFSPARFLERPHVVHAAPFSTSRYSRNICPNSRGFPAESAGFPSSSLPCGPLARINRLTVT